MGKNVIIYLISILCISNYAVGQECDTCVYKFKLDYDIPESPAFSIIDANPSNVMRGSAAKEFALSVANNFIRNNRQETGIAADINPFLMLYRFQNINEYLDNYGKRLLANTQLSFASIQSDIFPNDNLFSGGLRITLYDDFDLLQDTQLRKDIDNALKPENGIIPGTAQDSLPEVKNKKLDKAYEDAHKRIKGRDKKGFALSVGVASALRAHGGKIDADSLGHYRFQTWLSGQYNFGKGWNIMGMAMYRNTKMEIDDLIDFVGGLGIRYISKRFGVGGEFMYSLENQFEYGANLEYLLGKGILLGLRFGNDNEEINSNRWMLKPTIKYNLSQ